MLKITPDSTEYRISKITPGSTEYCTSAEHYTAHTGGNLVDTSPIIEHLRIN